MKIMSALGTTRTNPLVSNCMLAFMLVVNCDCDGCTFYKIDKQTGAEFDSQQFAAEKEGVC